MFCFITPISLPSLSSTRTSFASRQSTCPLFTRLVHHSVSRGQTPVTWRSNGGYRTAGSGMVMLGGLGGSGGSGGSGSSGLGIRIVSGVLVAGFLISSILPLAGLFKNAFSTDGEALVNDKLSKVPVFTVTDTTGRPYLSETADGRLRRGFFFMQPADAENYLQKVQADAGDAKVLVVGLDKAMQFVENKSSRPKAIPERFELFPDDHELALAEQLSSGRFVKTFGKAGIPLFYLDGLAVQDDSGTGTVIPLFFEKELLDEAYDSLKKKDVTATVDMKDLEIVDLSTTMKELRAGADNRYSRVVLIPLTQAVKSLKAMTEQQ